MDMPKTNLHPQNVVGDIPIILFSCCHTCYCTLHYSGLRDAMDVKMVRKTSTDPEGLR